MSSFDKSNLTLPVGFEFNTTVNVSELPPSVTVVEPEDSAIVKPESSLSFIDSVIDCVPSSTEPPPPDTPVISIITVSVFSSI